MKQKRQVNGDLDVQIYSWILGLKPFLLRESLAKLGGNGRARYCQGSALEPVTLSLRTSTEESEVVLSWAFISVNPWGDSLH